MARDYYQDTIVTTDEKTGEVFALGSVEIEVFEAATGDRARIYTTHDPADKTTAPNPYATDKTGSVAFYAEVGEYRIRINDPRVGRTEFFWNAVNTSSGGIPFAALGADLRRQVTQIGQVIDWWRPVWTMDPPAGFKICDGSPVPAGEHDFPVSGAITLPDLRNQFIIGADAAVQDGTASSNGDGSPNPRVVDGKVVAHHYAPGIGGVGGKNTAIDFRHTHDISHEHAVPFIDHQHTGATPDHLHGNGTLSAADHQHYVPKAGPEWRSQYFKSYTTQGPDDDGLHATVLPNLNHDHQTVYANGFAAGFLAVAGATGSADRSLAFTTSTAVATVSTVNGTKTISQSKTDSAFPTWDAVIEGLRAPNGTATDVRPAHVGLLKLMKVKWS